MGLGRKVGAFLGLVPEDESRYGETPGYDGEHFETGRYDGEQYSADRHDGDRYGTQRYEDERYEGGRYDGDRYETGRPEPRGSSPESTPVHGALAIKPAPALRPVETSASGRPAKVRLTSFTDARLIGEQYRDGQSVILDMTEMSDGDARRLVDFSAGLAFALRGSIDKVATKVFMLLPPDADVAAAAADFHAGHQGR